MKKVAIFMGSASDEPIVAPCAEILNQLGISYILTVSSAHRSPERTSKLVQDLEASGTEVFICAAGMAAHLAGAVAAKTIKPVIAIPINASSLSGFDALLSSVQMPPGFPVATVSLDKAGAKNAAYLAAQILALNDPQLSAKIKQIREDFKTSIEKSALEIENKYKNN